MLRETPVIEAAVRIERSQSTAAPRHKRAAADDRPTQTRVLTKVLIAMIGTRTVHITVRRNNYSAGCAVPTIRLWEGRMIPLTGYHPFLVSVCSNSSTRRSKRGKSRGLVKKSSA
jgi:hypothetical protein